MARNPETPDKVRFDWCVTGQHGLCRRKFTTGTGITRTCECDCTNHGADHAEA